MHDSGTRSPHVDNRRRHCRIARALGAVIAMTLVATACERTGTPEVGPVGENNWLVGDVREQLDTVAAHIGGMGDAMMHVGERYIELHWAGENRNWALAAHQIEEIVGTIDRATVRRPDYSRGKEIVLDGALPALGEAVAQEDIALFRERFAELTVACNSCHMMNEHAYIRVVAPRTPTKPWHAPSE